MNEFKRELRYAVVKVKHLDKKQREDVFLDMANMCISHQIPFVQNCIVIENNWPIYEEVWDMVQRLAEGREQKIVELQTKLAESEARVERLRVHAEIAVQRMAEEVIPYADVLSRIVKQTPAQSLAAHDAEVVDKVLDECAWYHNREFIKIDELLTYASKLRQQQTNVQT